MEGDNSTDRGDLLESFVQSGDLVVPPISEDMPTEVAGIAIMDMRVRITECMKILRDRLRIFLQNLLGPCSDAGGDRYMVDFCNVWVQGGRVHVSNLYGGHGIRDGRKFGGGNLCGILEGNSNLVDDVSRSGVDLSFTVPLDRFNRIVDGDGTGQIMDHVAETVGLAFGTSR